MLFSSITFLYYFLPAVVLLYFIMPRKGKNAVLLLSSLAFYGWGEPKLLFLMLFTIAMFYGCGIAIGRAQTQQKKKFWLTVSVVISISLLALFKYADFFIGNFNAVNLFFAFNNKVNYKFIRHVAIIKLVTATNQRLAFIG